MSQAHVQRVIGQLATDEHWRGRYRQNAAETLVALVHTDDLDLTAGECHALIATGADAFDAFARALDPRLQRLERAR